MGKEEIKEIMQKEKKGNKDNVKGNNNNNNIKGNNNIKNKGSKLNAKEGIKEKVK